jgi:hypothetical protein
MAGGGPNPSIIYNALWKTVGSNEQGSFYNQFYARFGQWLSYSAVSEGKSATSLAETLHKGIVDLGLQMVRDTVSSAAGGTVHTNVFGDGGVAPTNGYVQLDVRSIQDPYHVGTPFGVVDVNNYIYATASGDMGSLSPWADTVLANWFDYSWKVITVQAGTQSNPDMLNNGSARY